MQRETLKKNNLLSENDKDPLLTFGPGVKDEEIDEINQTVWDIL